jgi:hypothetical protein
LNDLEATELIQRIIGVKIPAEIQRYEKQKRDFMIIKHKGAGLSIKQISRLTSVSFEFIRGI